MNSTQLLRATSVSCVLACAAFAPATLSAQSATGDVFYTDYTFHTVNKVHYNYDGVSTFTLSAPTLIQTLGGADGVIFDTLGNLLVGGQGSNVYRVNPTSGHVDTSTTSGSSNFHLGLSPDGKTVLGGGIPGPLNEIGLPGFGPGTVHSITLAGSGAGIGVDTIAFDPTHGDQAYFTSSAPNGNGLFGTIDLSTFIATPIIDPAEPNAKVSAHGLSWDSYINKFVLMGENEISTYDPATGLFKSTTISGFNFDQGTVDGKGHLFVAGNGDITFINYATTMDPTDPLDFRASPFVTTFIDDVAPLSGPGSNPGGAVPEPSTYGLFAAGSLLTLCLVRRRLKRS